MNDSWGGSVVANSLVLVESPTKAKTILKMLGAEYRVMASLGHIRDLPSDRLGVDESNFDAQYVIVKGREKTVKEIKSAAKQADRIFIATDPDREGEAIGWHLAEEIQAVPDQIFRVLFHELTGSAVAAAMGKPIRLAES